MRKTIVKLFNPDKAPALLFLGIIFLVGVTTNSLSDTIKELTGLDSWLITTIGLVLLLTIILFFDPVSKFVNFLVKRRGELISSMGMLPQRYKGLIVFCSIGENISAEQAIRYHYKDLENEHKEPILEHCWLITCGEASLQAAKNLVNKLVQDNFPPKIFEDVPKPGEYADNPEEIFKVIEEIYKSLPEGFVESDIIADYSGGTKSMTAGMILACALPERKLQMLKPKKYKEDGTADRTAGSEPRYIDIRFKLKQVSK